MRGGVIGIWVPSTEPAHCGTPHFSLKPVITTFKPSPVGKRMYSGTSFCTIALHGFLTMIHTVHLAIPNRWATVWYSDGVAKIQSVIATRLSTDTGLLITVVSFSTNGLNCSQR